MKKLRTIIILALTVVMCLSLAACGSKDISETPSESADKFTEDPESPDTVQFKGKIDSIDGNEAIVTPDEGEDILSSGDAVRVDISN